MPENMTLNGMNKMRSKLLQLKNQYWLVCMNDETWNHSWQQIASFIMSVWTLPEIFVPARRYERMLDTLNNPASFDLSICQFPQVSWQRRESIEAGETGELLPLSESGLERSKFKLLT